MNVYVESNFVLELALLQEQSESCEEILRLAEARKVTLVAPAYCLVEPYETLGRRERHRKRMKTELDDELKLLARTSTNSKRLGELRDVTSLLLDSADDEMKRLGVLRERVLGAAEIIPMESHVLRAAAMYQETYRLAAQDALVLASVLDHLEQSARSSSCFLNRNSRDFDDPDIIEELETRSCRLIPRFDDGCRYLLAAGRSKRNTRGRGKP